MSKPPTQRPDAKCKVPGLRTTPDFPLENGGSLAGCPVWSALFQAGAKMTLLSLMSKADFAYNHLRYQLQKLDLCRLLKQSIHHRVHVATLP